MSKNLEMPFKMVIGGDLYAGVGALEVINPATGRPFASAPLADASTVDRAVAAAKSAFPAWAARGFSGRRALLVRLADMFEARADEVARLLTQEQGKPLDQARFEVGASVAALRYFAEQTLEDRILRDTANERIVEQRYPLGTVVSITPWNFPVLLLIFKIAPALIAGNVVIAKPAPTTPLTTLLIGELASAVLPAGVFQTIVDRNDLGSVLTEHPGVDHVSFTGSATTGKKVLASTGKSLKRVALELGGNDAAIVLDDADVETIAPRIFEGAMMNAGQICLAVKRVYAPQAMLDELCAVLGRLAKSASVGDGLQQGNTIGPVQNKAQFDKLLGLLDDARRNGKIVAGGNRIEGNGYFIQPTIVRDVAENSRIVTEEQFGPILPVIGYDDLNEAIAKANDSDYGLGGTVWTSNPDRGIEVASRIETGLVWINKFLDLPFDVPVSGAKQSGSGRQLGIESIEEFTQARIVNAALA
ncbi:MAG: aldehyde dehydrogenase family protein [Pseudorhodoplanes sp.]|uniref:aldehyde dehydrogenase family protein n=1 Tax=Pseudorhodoplanes sp. TaxID=1934341 RepID=UPI003D0FCB8A